MKVLLRQLNRILLRKTRRVRSFCRTCLQMPSRFVSRSSTNAVAPMCPASPSSKSKTSNQFPRKRTFNLLNLRYCESSSLHGLKYITEDGRHWTERVLWIMLCLCGFILTVYFIHPIWARWNEKPTITTLDSTDHPVWEIDYPAVTICPANKVVEEKLRRVLRENA